MHLYAELVIGNVVRRVMYIIREEMDQQEEVEVAPESTTPARVGGLSRALSKSSASVSNRWNRSFSLHNLLDQEVFDAAVAEASPGAGALGGKRDHNVAAPDKEADQDEAFAEKKQAVMEEINGLIDELKDIDFSIAANAPEHIHANEVVLTFGYSRTVLQFLKRAKEKRDFQVIVSEGSPRSEGFRLAVDLEKMNIRTTTITDASCYAVMARVNKVVISAHALLADGGVMAPVGTSMLAAAAKKHNVPVVILAGIYKLSPNFPHEPGITFNEFGDPSEILSFSHEAIFAAERAGMKCVDQHVCECFDNDETSTLVAEANFSIMEEKGSESCKPFLQVHNPSFDYIPPDRISLFVTDHGHGFMPSYVYRQLSEFYNRQDYQLSKQLEAAMSR